jgi:hypothetical protein
MGYETDKGVIRVNNGDMAYMLDPHKGTDQLKGLGRIQYKNLCGHDVFYFKHTASSYSIQNKLLFIH